MSSSDIGYIRPDGKGKRAEAGRNVLVGASGVGEKASVGVIGIRVTVGKGVRLGEGVALAASAAVPSWLGAMLGF